MVRSLDSLKEIIKECSLIGKVQSVQANQKAYILNCALSLKAIGARKAEAIDVLTSSCSGYGFPESISMQIVEKVYEDFKKSKNQDSQD